MQGLRVRQSRNHLIAEMIEDLKRSTENLTTLKTAACLLLFSYIYVHMCMYVCMYICMKYAPNSTCCALSGFPWLNRITSLNVYSGDGIGG